MYLAVEKPTSIKKIVINASNAISEKTDVNWFALIDGAFDYESTPFAGLGSKIKLYDNPAMADLAKASPYLIKLTSHDVTVLHHELSLLLKHRSRKPMLSLVSTTLTASELNTSWQDKLNVTTEDGQTFVLRFADTRISPLLSEKLTDTIWSALTENIHDWLIINRRGELEWLPISKNNKAVLPLVIDEQGLSDLIEYSQPDAIINVFNDSMPDILPNEKRFEFYEHVVSACQLGEDYQVTAFPDLVALASYICLTDGKGMRDEQLLTILQTKGYDSGSLINDLVNLMDEIEDEQ